MPKLEANVRRDQVIRATYKAFIEKGAANVTLQDIAEYAGCSKGVVAYHFHSKEEVFVSLLEWLIGEIRCQVEESVKMAPDPQARLRAFVDSVFFGARENRRFFLVYLDFVAQGLRNPSFRYTNVSFYDICRSIGREIVKSGIAEGVFRPVDLEEASAVLRAIFDGLSIQWLFDESGSTEETFEKYKGWAFSSVQSYLQNC
ncbi:MAG TPA: TetR/AcrR family transcriptional regulator [Chloroflexia bacterium]|nr:TetR/AcrR family transcriptional regulator [Chloroflexia bacterium]